MTFEPLSVGSLIRGQSRSPGCLCTDTVQEIKPNPRVTVSTVAHVSLKSSEVGTIFSFKLTGNCGAALVTTYGEDAELKSVFEEYTKWHYKSWVTFTCSHSCGDDVRPMLVSGVDLTGNFAMLAYSNPDEDLFFYLSSLLAQGPFQTPFFPGGNGMCQTLFTLTVGHSNGTTLQS